MLERKKSVVSSQNKSKKKISEPGTKYVLLKNFFSVDPIQTQKKYLKEVIANQKNQTKIEKERDAIQEEIQNIFKELQNLYNPTENLDSPEKLLAWAETSENTNAKDYYKKIIELRAKRDAKLEELHLLQEGMLHLQQNITNVDKIYNIAKQSHHGSTEINGKIAEIYHNPLQVQEHKFSGTLNVTAEESLIELDKRHNKSMKENIEKQKEELKKIKDNLENLEKTEKPQIDQCLRNINENIYHLEAKMKDIYQLLNRAYPINEVLFHRWAESSKISSVNNFLQKVIQLEGQRHQLEERQYWLNKEIDILSDTLAKKQIELNETQTLIDNKIRMKTTGENDKTVINKFKNRHQLNLIFKNKIENEDPMPNAPQNSFKNN